MACLAALSKMPQASADYLGYNIFCEREIYVNAEIVKFVRILEISNHHQFLCIEDYRFVRRQTGVVV
jgi:hypothetical protein